MRSYPGRLSAATALAADLHGEAVHKVDAVIADRGVSDGRSHISLPASRSGSGAGSETVVTIVPTSASRREP